jgi:poly-gamma-glutamate synthesis protein (capsule biosynthesis protein)
MKKILFILIILNIFFVSCLTYKYEAKKDQEITILAFGDLILGRYVKDVINRHGQDEILKQIDLENSDFFKNKDFIFANLEGPVTEFKANTTKEIAFRFEVEDLKILTSHNINLVSTSNNHGLDMGNRGFEDTKKYLNENKILAFGNPKNVLKDSFIEIEKNGYKIAFIAFNDTDFKLDYTKAFELIKSLKLKNDFVFLSIHWGNEYMKFPTNKQKEDAKKFIEAGADIIIGHHPHVLQGMEIINKKPVFYSLGNFIFDQMDREDTQETLGVLIRFSKDKIETSLIPIKSRKARPYLPKEDEASKVLENFKKISF